MNRSLLLALLLVLSAAPFLRGPASGDVGFDPLEARGRQVELAIETGRFSDGLPVALDLQRSHPDEPLVLYWLTEIYRGLGRPRDEVLAWQAYLRLSSAPEDACPWLAEAYAHAGDAEAALGQYRDCVSIDPDEPQRLLDLAAAQAARHQMSDALESYARAAALDPRDPAIPRLAGALHRTAGGTP